MTYTAEERYWIWLSSVEGVGLKRFNQLLEIYETAQEVWENVGDQGMLFLGKAVLGRLKQARTDEYMDGVFARLERASCRAIPRFSEKYPALLAEIYDAPVTLYVSGDADLSAERMFSVVGSRRCTRDGQRAAREISAQLAREGVTVVSGMARGTDTAAHQGALSAHAPTIAVFGCGTDVIYPPENVELAAHIIDDGGALVSEYPPGTQPNAGHFPARNRIISGLTPGTLIVEGDKKSGAMITVNDALEQDRDVFAVPGSIYSALSATPNRLIVEGAKPVLSAWEILEYYRWAQRPEENVRAKPQTALTEEERRIVLPLTEQELSFEELTRVTGIPVQRLNTCLTMLELRGILVKVPGGYRAYLS